MTNLEQVLSQSHPVVQEVVRRGLQVTLTNILRRHRDDRVELAEIEREAMQSDDFGSW